MRTIVDLPEYQIERLKAIGQQSKLSRAEIIRRALAEYLERHPPDHEDAAFGLWKDRDEDGLEYQQRQRSEWQ